MSRRILALVIVVAASRPLGAQTTGRLAGQAADDQGQPVPGATVAVSGPSLQGARVARTNARGEFLIAFLPPGSYGVRVELAGFRPLEAAGVRIELDRTATLRARLELAALQETVVVGTSPLDLSGAATGLNATAELYTRLPLDRSYLAVARIAPGTQQDEVGTACYGSTGAENQYVIDGLNVTGVEYGGSCATASGLTPPTTTSRWTWGRT